MIFNSSRTHMRVRIVLQVRPLQCLAAGESKRTTSISIGEYWAASNFWQIVLFTLPLDFVKPPWGPAILLDWYF